MICIVLATLVACARAQVFLPFFSLPLFHPLASSQFHAQDGLGQFSFGYTGNNQFRTESRLLDGSVRGSYSYVDPNNKMVHVVYIADSAGFRVLEGNNLPTVPAVPVAPAPLELPKPVDYTPEVAAARAEFEKTYNELAAKAEAAVAEEPEATEERRKRSVLLPTLYTISPAALKIKVTEGVEVTDVVSPASTKPVEYTEVEKSVPFTPLVVAPAAFHYTAPYYSFFYTS